MNSKLAPLTLAVSMVTAGCATLAFAESQATTLDQVVVTASRMEESVSSIAGTVRVIEQAEIEQQSVPGQKLADVLERLVPGMGPSTQIATDRTQTIRGRKVLVLIDGIPQRESRQISRQMNIVRPENIERIEVVSGATAVYGANGAGGIINIITKKPENDALSFSSSVGITTPTDNVSSDSLSWLLSQGVSGQQGDFDFRINATVESRGGFIDGNGDRIAPEPAQVSRSDTDTKDLFVKLGYDLNESQRIEADIQVFRDEMDSDYGPDYGENMAYLAPFGSVITDGENQAVKGLNLEDQPLSKRNSYSLAFIDDDFFDHKANLQLFYRDREFRFFPFAYDLSSLGIPTTIVNQSTSTAKAHGLKFTLDNEVNDRLKLVYGIDYQNDQGEESAQSYDGTAFTASNGLTYQPEGNEYQYGPDVEMSTWAGFIQGKLNLTEKLVLRTGLRHEKITTEIGDYQPVLESWLVPITPVNTYSTFKGGEKKYSATLFNVGLVYQLNEGNDVFANYSEGFEVPDAARLLRNVLPANSGLASSFPQYVSSFENTNLDATKIKSYELGWRGSFDRFESTVTAFYNISDKTVAFTNNYGVDILDQEKKVYGIESSATYFINDYWLAGGSYTFTEGRTYDKDEGKWFDLSAADVSPQKTTAYIGYEESDYSVRLQVLNFADYDKGYDSSGTKESIEGYTIFDLLTSFYLPVGRVDAALNNLFNKDYQTVYSQWAQKTYGVTSAVPAQGRTLSLTYSVEY